MSLLMELEMESTSYKITDYIHNSYISLYLLFYLFNYLLYSLIYIQYLLFFINLSAAMMMLRVIFCS